MIKPEENVHLYLAEELEDFPEYKGHELVISFENNELGFTYIVAIHSTAIGNLAFGGCRIRLTDPTGKRGYRDVRHAAKDALGLAFDMSMKNANALLKALGGKSTGIVKKGHEKKIHDEEWRKATFTYIGHCLNYIKEVHGKHYITAEDSGTKPADMNYIAVVARKHVVGVEYEGGVGDPSPSTAWGVFVGMQTALKKLDKSLNGTTVSVQGAAGNVGKHLCKLLHDAGAKLVLSDLNQEAVQKMGAEYGAVVMENPDDIFDHPTDIFAPCALSGALNDDTIPRLDKAMKKSSIKLICGAANSQLVDKAKHGKMIQKREMNYVEASIINAGGVLCLKDEAENPGTSPVFNREKTNALIAKIIGDNVENMFIPGTLMSETAYNAALSRIEAENAKKPGSTPALDPRGGRSRAG